MRRQIMKILLMAVVILISGSESMAGPVADAAAVYMYVKKQYPEVKWDETTIKSGDINCDNNTDFALLGQEGKRVTVGVLIGPLSQDSRVFILKLYVGIQTQDSLCQLPAVLETEDLDYDPSEMLGGPIPGFVRSKICKGFNVSDGACDSFHFFWNHDLNVVQWWRL